MMHGRGRWRIGLGLLVLMTRGTAWAEAATVNYQFSGVITSAASSANRPPGTPFTGTFTYDTDDLSGSPTIINGQASYVFYPTPSNTSSVAIWIDGNSIPMGGGLALSLGEPGLVGSTQNQTQLLISNELPSPNYNLSILFSNPSQAVYPTFGLPSAIGLADFPSATIEVTPSGSGFVQGPLYVGTIETLTPVATPEPATWVVLGLGLAARFLGSGRRAAR